MMKKKESSTLNVTKLNRLITLGHSVLKVLFVVLIAAGIYVATVILRDIKFFNYLFAFLNVLSPLFIGLVIAWLFHPIVTFLAKKGVRRNFGSALCFFVFFIVIYLVLNSLVPLLADQINEFVTNTIPSVFDSAESLIDSIFEQINAIEGFDADSFKDDIFARIGQFAASLTETLPDLVVSIVTAIFSGVGTFVIGLIIGFLLLIDFDKHVESLFNLLPKKHRKEAKEIAYVMEVPLRSFIKGAIIDCSVVFVICSIVFSLIGLKSPIIFALFCALTNIIPYAGPYIGGTPAVLVGLTQSLPIGIGILITIVVLQFLEGNFLQPYIMSKTTNLSPIIIILGLLVFGYFFGIIGMIISTPLLAMFKELFIYFNNKYDLINLKSD